MRRPVLLLVDRDVSQIAVLRAELAAIGHRLEVIEEPERALVSLGSIDPSIVVIDQPKSETFPRADLIHALRAARTARQMSIVAILSPSSARVRAACLESGADLCLDAPLDPRELAARARILQASRERGERGAAFDAGELSIDVPALRARYRGRTINLSAIGFQILRLLLEEPMRPLARASMADMLRTRGYDPPRALVSQVMRLKAALAEAGFEGSIRHLRGEGYRLLQPNEP